MAFAQPFCALWACVLAMWTSVYVGVPVTWVFIGQTVSVVEYVHERSDVIDVRSPTAYRVTSANCSRSLRSCNTRRHCIMELVEPLCSAATLCDPSVLSIFST